MIRGEFSRLERLIGQLHGMASPAWRAGLSRAAAEAARERISASFAEERDPWGKPWQKSLRAELEGGQTLSDTGRLRRSFGYRITQSGFVIGTNVLYAATHQRGAVIRAKRAPYLKFRLAGGSGRRKSRRGQWVQTKSVNIPSRPFIPEPNLSPIWHAAIDAAVRDYINADQRSI